MADYWIKLYHEIIDDPKMATLPDRLWRRTIELFLLAGKLCPDKSGNLPDTRQLAWLLRMQTDDLQADLSQLATTGIIEAIPNGWLIINFEKRQAAASSTERVKHHRERKHREQYNGDVTNLKRNVTQINRAETETETETEQSITASSDFDLFMDTITKAGILPQTSGDVNNINAMIDAGVTLQDLKDGIAWKVSNNGDKAIYSVSQLVGPAKTAMAKRMQQGFSPPKRKRILKGANGETIEVEE